MTENRIISGTVGETAKIGDKIMIVDDDPHMRSALSLGLSKLNMKGEIFSSAEDALEYINKNINGKHFNDFFLIISDLNLSGMDGVSFLNSLKTIDEFNNIPFVIITAYGTIESAISAIKNGAADYLLKPFGIADLENIIKNSKERIIHYINNTFDADKNNINSAQIINNADNSSGKSIININILDNAQLNGNKNDFIFLSEKMKEIESFINVIAPTDATVLITGESGTGKEVAAKYIHNKSGRKGDFIAVNCSAIVSTLLESELFGHEKGAFTGASSRKIGKFELADGGTILLDEIGDMDKNLQAKILRTLQENYIDRVGGDSPVRINSRVIAATNKDLKKMVEEGMFREDLYYRLNVLPIELPPLRERKIDIKPLSIFFIRKYTMKYFRKIGRISEEALTYLLSLDYKGNVRELENIIERGVILAQNSDTLNISHLSGLNHINVNGGTYHSHDKPVSADDFNSRENSRDNNTNTNSVQNDYAAENCVNESCGNRNYVNIDDDRNYTNINTNINDNINDNVVSSCDIMNSNHPDSVNNDIAKYGKGAEGCIDIPTIREMEKKLIGEALKKTGGNKNKASELLGITSRTLRNKLKEFEAESGTDTKD
ncbi:MAG: sigma-54-dependent Fis family transcriptional regulator [Candidatus Acididesulfobacter guangdongensis]|uniref:Sigma-54-dependent Fis family transcriptional regulator n=1 Tax=Acididesulfobacter guangdongensis TaxID=2597225 RepID=A0A519BG38_ACIG2|nr:MAG: sigma-54-dependent Fis family transcriptional regulator [Candidatus Acididesulfobacter guangdongensis]